MERQTLIPLPGVDQFEQRLITRFNITATKVVLMSGPDSSSRLLDSMLEMSGRSIDEIVAHILDRNGYNLDVSSAAKLMTIVADLKAWRDWLQGYTKWVEDLIEAKVGNERVRLEAKVQEIIAVEIANLPKPFSLRNWFKGWFRTFSERFLRKPQLGNAPEVLEPIPPPCLPPPNWHP